MYCIICGVGVETKFTTKEVKRGLAQRTNNKHFEGSCELLRFKSELNCLLALTRAQEKLCFKLAKDTSPSEGFSVIGRSNIFLLYQVISTLRDI